MYIKKLLKSEPHLTWSADVLSYPECMGCERLLEILNYVVHYADLDLGCLQQVTLRWSRPLVQLT